jgi:hypothetical protein
MISGSDSFNTVDLGKYYAILSPSAHYSQQHYCAATGGQRVPAGFAYNSGTNPDFLSVEQLRALIRDHVTGESAG